METLYDVLEVSRKASKEVIEKAYKTLAKKYHPDVQMPENKAKAEEMMKKINEAYGILSDDQKRKGYDAKLEAEEQRNAQNNNYNNSSYSANNNYYKPQNNNKTPYSNTTYNQANYYSQQEYNTNENAKNNDWREAYSKLSKKEQKKLKRKIEKEANEEYRKMYEEHLRNLGYRVKHKWTFKEFLSIIIAIVIIVIILLVLWWIPPTHEWMMNMYENNIVVKIFADIIIGICKNFVGLFKN